MNPFKMVLMAAVVASAFASNVFADPSVTLRIGTSRRAAPPVRVVSGERRVVRSLPARRRRPVHTCTYRMLGDRGFQIGVSQTASSSFSRNDACLEARRSCNSSLRFRPLAVGCYELGTEPTPILCVTNKYSGFRRLLNSYTGQSITSKLNACSDSMSICNSSIGRHSREFCVRNTPRPRSRSGRRHH